MIGPTKLHKLLLDAAQECLRQAPGMPFDKLIVRIVDTQTGAVMNELDPDCRLEECEECERCDADLLMEQKIDGKAVCYDCFVALGGEPEGDGDGDDYFDPLRPQVGEEPQ